MVPGWPTPSPSDQRSRAWSAVVSVPHAAPRGRLPSYLRRGRGVYRSGVPVRRHPPSPVPGSPGPSTGRVGPSRLSPSGRRRVPRLHQPSRTVPTRVVRTGHQGAGAAVVAGKSSPIPRPRAPVRQDRGCASEPDARRNRGRRRGRLGGIRDGPVGLVPVARHRTSWCGATG